MTFQNLKRRMGFEEFPLESTYHYHFI